MYFHYEYPICKYFTLNSHMFVVFVKRMLHFFNSTNKNQATGLGANEFETSLRRS